MQSVAHIRAVLEERGLSPLKRFGQNFLIDHGHIRRLVDASGVGAGSVVLEVGPGTGTLTEELLERGCTVVAAEIDKGLSELLRTTFAGNPRFVLVEGDCLEGKHALAPALVEALARSRPAPGVPFTLVANLPYAAGTPVMMILLADEPSCAGLYVTVQKEVAERLAAQPGTKEYGPLSVLAQATCEVRMLAKLPPGCFWPQPEVTSAMVGMKRLAAPLCDAPRSLLTFLHELFEKRRKQLGAVLPKGAALPAGVRSTDRAEALSVPTLIELWRLHARGAGTGSGAGSAEDAGGHQSGNGAGGRRDA